MRRSAALCCLSTALAVGGLSGCDWGAGGDGNAKFKRADAGKVVLNPQDLGRGYVIGSESGCGQFETEEQSEQFMKFFFDAKPGGCRNQINYIWGGPRTKVIPRSVQSGVAIFDNEADARRGMKMRGELLRFMVGESPRDLANLSDFGHEAVRFRNGGYHVSPGAGVVWRNGNMVAVVFAGGEGMTLEQAPKVALDLARKQQVRIEHPSAEAPNNKMDPELPLNDPSLDVPVYWLGREFRPSALPALHLASTANYPGSNGVPGGFTAELDYGSADRKTYGIKLWVFRPDAFEKFKHGVIGRIVGDAPCAKATKLDVPGGRAVIWGGFAKPARPPCPSRPYDRYVPYVYLKGAVVTVNHPWCIYPCGTPLKASDPYNTARGIAAIAKALRIRQQPRRLN